MLQQRLFVCLPTAIAEAERATRNALDGLKPRERRRVERSLRAARNWWASANSRYVNGVVKVLDSRRPDRYALGTGGYSWTYPGQGASRVRKALRGAFGDLIHAPVSDGTRSFVIPTKRRSAKPAKVGDLLQTGNTFFAAEISPAQRARVLELEALHDEAARSFVCKAQTLGLTAEGWCPGMRPAPEIVSEYDSKSIDGVLGLGLPLIAPFAKGTNPDLTFEEVCPIVQRKVRNHQAWTKGVLNGHTPEGFRDAWIAMFAHAIVHAEGLLGERVPGTDRLKPPVRNLVEASVPGVKNGSCEIDAFPGL